MVRWHCPTDTEFEIRALAVWDRRARYLWLTQYSGREEVTRCGLMLTQRLRPQPGIEWTLGPYVQVYLYFSKWQDYSLYIGHIVPKSTSFYCLSGRQSDFNITAVSQFTDRQMTVPTLTQVTLIWSITWPRADNSDFDMSSFTVSIPWPREDNSHCYISWLYMVNSLSTADNSDTNISFFIFPSVWTTKDSSDSIIYLVNYLGPTSPFCQLSDRQKTLKFRF